MLARFVGLSDNNELRPYIVNNNMDGTVPLIITSPCPFGTKLGLGCDMVEGQFLPIFYSSTDLDFGEITRAGGFKIHISSITIHGYYSNISHTYTYDITIKYNLNVGGSVSTKSNTASTQVSGLSHPELIPECNIVANSAGTFMNMTDVSENKLIVRGFSGSALVIEKVEESGYYPWKFKFYKSKPSGFNTDGIFALSNFYYTPNYDSFATEITNADTRVIDIAAADTNEVRVLAQQTAEEVKKINGSITNYYVSR